LIRWAALLAKVEPAVHPWRCNCNQRIYKSSLQGCSSSRTASTVSVALQLHPQAEPDVKASDCKPMAAVANTKSVAIIERRIVDWLFIVLS